MKYDDTIIIIPARFGSTRLPGKSLADINGKPMVVRVVEIAKSLDVCDVLVATESQKVVDVVNDFGYDCILTDDNLQSGTDRIYQALNKTGRQNKYEYVINLQGDMPNIDKKIILDVIEMLHQNDKIQIATAISKIEDKTWIDLPQVVKAVIAFNPNQNCHRCLYFTRAGCPTGTGDKYAHLGIYGYRYDALKKFVSLPQSLLEKSEKLEQLRALENGIDIYACVVKNFPISVDVAEDLEKARRMIK